MKPLKSKLVIYNWIRHFHVKQVVRGLRQTNPLKLTETDWTNNQKTTLKSLKINEKHKNNRRPQRKLKKAMIKLLNVVVITAPLL